MTEREIQYNHDNIERMLDYRRVYLAGEKLRGLLQQESLEGIRSRFDEAYGNYRLMLQYMSKGVDDPSRREIYNKLIERLYSINDEIRFRLLYTVSPSLMYGTRRLLDTQRLTVAVAEQRYRDALAAYYRLHEQPEPHDAVAIKAAKDRHEAAETDLFNVVWTSTPGSDDDEALRRILLAKPSIYAERLSGLLVSALLLSLLYSYDEGRFALLFDTYEQSQSLMVKTRALVAIGFVATRHRRRCELSGDVMARLKMLGDSREAFTDCRTIALQYLRATEAEAMSKKIRDDIMPRLRKINPDILRPEVLTDEEKLADENVMGQLDQSGLINSIMDMNNRQASGDDIVATAFAQLKRFPFFNTLANWFLPFDTLHSMVPPAMVDLPDIFAATPLCDSDRFSFVSLALSMPPKQRDAMFGNLMAQREALEEASEDILANTGEDEKRKRLIINYITCLYRFAKVYPRSGEFFPLFSLKPFSDNSLFSDLFVADAPTLREAARIYFEHGRPEESLAQYERLEALGSIEADDCNLAGQCEMALKQYDRALTWLERANMLEQGNAQLLRRIATCQRALGNHRAALTSLLQIEDMQPENHNLLTTIGHCYYEIGDVSKALEYYYKVDYLSGSTPRSSRAIAWCEFVTGNIEKAASQYMKIAPQERTPDDWLNMGHVALAQSDIAEAAKCYRRYIEANDKGAKGFIAAINDDTPFLIEKGIDRLTINLVVDYSLFRTSGEIN